MPIDPAIALQTQGIGPLVNPLQVQQQVQQQQLARQQAAALEEQRKSLALERQQTTEKLARENAARTAFGQALQQGQGIREASRQAAMTLNPDALPMVDDYFDKVETSAAAIKDKQAQIDKINNGLNDDYNNHIGHAMDFALNYAKGDPEKLHDALAMTAADYAQRFPHEAQRAAQAFQTLTSLPPQEMQSRMEQARAASPYYQAEQAKPAQVVPEGGSLVGPGGNVVFQGKPKPPTEVEIKQQYEGLFKKRLLHQPLSADEQATMTAYEQDKLLGPEAAAAAATNRQTRAIDAAAAAQNRTQTFAEQQAGRKELEDKIEPPFYTAKASAQMLRDTISAAQSGNMTAAALQSLETTMAAVRAQGLNRVNMAEIGLSAGAGSSWDRIQGWFGKAAAGQPVPPAVQKDMLQFADILDKSADQKYKQGWQSTIDRYGLTKEKPLVPMGAAPQGPAGPQPPTQPPSPPSAGGGPKVGERRMIGGKLGEWDGHGWKAVQ
jgi:hypothetical protein